MSWEFYYCSAALCAVACIHAMPDRESLEDWFLVLVLSSIPFVNAIVFVFVLIGIYLDSQVERDWRKHGNPTELPPKDPP